jgi:hypothetical protein
MTPFDINPDDDAGHAIDQDDIIAFHLHELTPQQERAFHRVLRTKPSLQAESLAVAATLHAFPKHEPAPTLDAAAASNRIWQSLRPSLIPYIPAAATPFSLRKLPLTRWAIPTLAGSALVAATIFVASRLTHPPEPATRATLSNPSSTIPAATTPQPQPPSNSHPYTFNSPSLTPHHAWPKFSEPIETATNIPAPPIFAPRTPVPPTSTNSAKPAIPNPAVDIPIAPSRAYPPAQSPAQRSPSSPIQPGRPIRTSAPHRPSFTELTLAILGDITPSHSSSYAVGSGTTLVPESLLQAPTPAVGALASVRQQFRPWLGYRLTASYSRPTFIDSYKPSNSSNQEGTYGSLNLTRTIYELSGTYVAQGPHRGRFTTSAEAGAGVLAIQSVDTTDYPTTNVHSFRPTAIVGVGTELALTRHWGIRAEYRALLYKPPAFASTGGASVPAGPLTFTSQPILGITYRFGANGAD